MEPGETIIEAMQREVKEEAGLHCEPVTLLSVEERGPAWIRFVFLARPTGTAHLVHISRGPLPPFPQFTL
jgi:8-oxo-dGDP phosphatase